MKPDSKTFAKLVSGSSLALVWIGHAIAGGLPAASTPTPTLDEFGLVALGAVVGVAGVITLLRRRK